MHRSRDAGRCREYEAATDGKEQLRYVAGADAKATYAARLQAGDEAFRKGMDQQFFG